jgi:ribosomal protein L10
MIEACMASETGLTMKEYNVVIVGCAQSLQHASMTKRRKEIRDTKRRVARSR